MILEISVKISKDVGMVFRNTNHNVAIPMKQASNRVCGMAMVYLTVPTEDIWQWLEAYKA